MASTYVATRAAAGRPIKDRTPGPCQVIGTYTVAAATPLVINDVIQMVPVPKGARITDVTLSATDIDSGTAVTLSVGDGNATARFIAANAVGQAGGIAKISVAAGLNFQYTVDDTVDILVAAAPTGTLDGTLTLVVSYVTDNAA